MSIKGGYLAGGDGYQGGQIIIGRNVTNGGIGGLKLPHYQSYVFAKDIQTSTWNHICYGYSPAQHRLQMFQDGIKVFSFYFKDEKE